ncbi:MAG: hypothetical protein LUD39_03870 [Opitutae bacterium]|nr:hypothetical protein [Opitutae bacterium]MCD8298878.1 hypothetical protein [Opitutae bacterium]
MRDDSACSDKESRKMRHYSPEFQLMGWTAARDAFQGMGEEWQAIWKSAISRHPPVVTKKRENLRFAAEFRPFLLAARRKSLSTRFFLARGKFPLSRLSDSAFWRLLSVVRFPERIVAELRRCLRKQKERLLTRKRELQLG